MTRTVALVMVDECGQYDANAVGCAGRQETSNEADQRNTQSLRAESSYRTCGKSIPFELITELPWNADTSLPRFNPLEKLPVLVLDDGSTVYESSYIVEWLERKYPLPPLLPSDDDGILAAKRCLVLADGVSDAFLSVFFERHRPKAQQSVPWIARQMRKIEGGLAELARLVGTRDHVVGDRFGLGDIGIGCVLGWFDIRFPEFDWRLRHPNMAEYFARLSERPSFRTTVPAPQVIRDAVV